MYIHVPAAWLASAGYVGLALCSLAALVWRHPLADLAAAEIGPVGAGFTALCLATGSLWGKPMWGAWWVWDARLTSVLVLFFLYLGHIALVRAFDDPVRGARAGAILALVGVVNLPIIKFSVDWWNTLHQPATITLTGAPGMHVDMLWPLLVCTLGFTLAFVGPRARAHPGGGDGAAHPRLAAGAQAERRMTHLPFIAASYALGVGVPAVLRRHCLDPAAARPAAAWPPSTRAAAADDPQAPPALDRAGLRPRPRLGDGAGLSAFSDNIVFFVAPSDLAAHAGSPGRTLRLGGLVEAGSVHRGVDRRHADRAVPRHRRPRGGGRHLRRHPARPVPRGPGRGHARQLAAGRHVPRLRSAGQARRELHAEGRRRRAEEGWPVAPGARRAAARPRPGTRSSPRPRTGNPDMIPELGHFALALACALAFAQAVLPIWGAHRGDARLMAAAPALAAGAVAGALVAAAAAWSGAAWATISPC